MKKKIPYNAGEFRKSSEGKVIICGHIWWPVEKVNAYHCIRVNDFGEPSDNTPRYIWDHGENWAEFTPLDKKV